MSAFAGSATPETERKAAEDEALDERIRRIARQEIVNFAILNSACPTEEYANIMRDQWAEWINDVR